MKIIDVEKKIGDFRLQIDQFEIEEGEIHGFIGSNGSGKTTLAKIIMDVLKPDKGKIDYGNLKMTDITMTSQRPYLLHDTVYENIVYPLKIRKIPPRNNPGMDGGLRFVRKRKTACKESVQWGTAKSVYAASFVFSPEADND